jgi:hypothetical protein
MKQPRPSSLVDALLSLQPLLSSQTHQGAPFCCSLLAMVLVISHQQHQMQVQPPLPH